MKAAAVVALCVQVATSGPAKPEYVYKETRQTRKFRREVQVYSVLMGLDEPPTVTLRRLRAGVSAYVVDRGYGRIELVADPDQVQPDTARHELCHIRLFWQHSPIEDLHGPAHKECLAHYKRAWKEWERGEL